MVKTGARSDALQTLLGQLGHTKSEKPAAPRLGTFPEAIADQVLQLYRSMGGVQDQPRLAPGGWDLAFDDGLLVELDEGFHFNRYRGETLNAEWEQGLPWTRSYREYSVRGEAKSGLGGRRWTNPSAEKLFGPPDPDGTFGALGAPRWKQRALYDSMKDAAAACGQVSLARLSIYDVVDDQSLDNVLYGKAKVKLTSIAELLRSRTVLPQ